MRKKIKVLIFLFIITFACILGYCAYPKTGTLDSFLFNNYDKENIQEIEIRSTVSREDKSFKDKDQINNILSKLSNVKLVRYYGNTSDAKKGTYYIYIYDKNDIITEVAIKGDEYIKIINDSHKYDENYKIIDNSLDIDYIDELISG